MSYLDFQRDWASLDSGATESLRPAILHACRRSAGENWVCRGQCPAEECCPAWRDRGVSVSFGAESHHAAAVGVPFCFLRRSSLHYCMWVAANSMPPTIDRIEHYIVTARKCLSRFVFMAWKRGFTTSPFGRDGSGFWIWLHDDKRKYKTDWMYYEGWRTNYWLNCTGNKFLNINITNYILFNWNL